MNHVNLPGCINHSCSLNKAGYEGCISHGGYLNHVGPRLTGHDGDVTVVSAKLPSFRTHPRVHSPNE